jgi:hypothetical protein
MPLRDLRRSDRLVDQPRIRRRHAADDLARRRVHIVEALPVCRRTIFSPDPRR